MASKQPDYHAYLLRLWRESGNLPWRAELVSPHTGAKHHFASWSQLMAFLNKLTGEGEEGRNEGDLEIP